MILSNHPYPFETEATSKKHLGGLTYRKDHVGPMRHGAGHDANTRCPAAALDRLVLAGHAS